jgi:hypothetical protein
MKKILKISFVIAVVFSTSIVIAQNQNAADIWSGDRSAVNTPQLDPNQDILPLGAGGAVLYDNGPLVNSPGTGAGGADESVVESPLTTFGFAHQIASDAWVADDFVVPSGGWDITKFVFYAYQTFSPTTSTMNDVRFIIYDGIPGEPGTNVVWGDASTNRLTSTIWSDIYRVNTTGNTDRPIMENTCEASISLPAGTYWVAWQTGGTLGSGPWAPVITITGQPNTGNGIQYFNGSWSSTQDNTYTQGFPFVIYGAAPVPVSNWALLIGVLLIGAFIVVRYRRSIIA